MRLILKTAEGEQSFTKKQILFAEEPVFTDSFKVYEALIFVPSLTLKLVYNETFGGDLIQYLAAYKKDITGCELQKDNGEKLFAGVIDTDKEIVIEDNTIKYEFISEVSEILDGTVVTGNYTYDTEIYPSIEQYNAGNPDNIRIGEGALEQLIIDTIAENLPGYTVELPDNLYELQPHYVSFQDIENHISQYDNLIGAGFTVNWASKTIAEVLKLLCVTAFCRIIIGSDKTIKVISYLDENTITPNGNIFPTSENLYHENQIELEISAIIYPYYIYYDTIGERYSLSTINPIADLNYFYTNHQYISYSDRTFEGLNSNLKAGNAFPYKSKNYIVTELKRYGGLMETGLTKIEMTAIEVEDV